jgi:hypothetical protein
MKKVLIFTYLQRHFKKMLPIINELAGNSNIQLYVVLMTQEEKQLAIESGIAYSMLDDYTEKKRNADFDLTWGLEPLINAIDRIQPDLFIAIEVNLILRNAVRYCRQKGYRNLIIQHGTPNRYSLHAFAPFEGDCFAAWGQFTKDFLVEHFVDKAKIVLTGGVPFDLSYSMKPDRKYIGDALGISLLKKWIVFTTQSPGVNNMPTVDEIRAGIIQTVSIARNFPDHQLIIQIHPQQTLEEIRKIVDEVPRHHAIVVKYKNTEELMAASDGVITFFSTTACDAVIMQKPLMLINLSDDKDFYPFAQMKAAYAAYDESDIKKTFCALLSSGNNLIDGQKLAAGYVNYLNDGNALSRVLDLIYAML